MTALAKTDEYYELSQDTIWISFWLRALDLEFVSI